MKSVANMKKQQKENNLVLVMKCVCVRLRDVPGSFLRMCLLQAGAVGTQRQ